MKKLFLVLTLAAFFLPQAGLGQIPAGITPNGLAYKKAIFDFGKILKEGPEFIAQICPVIENDQVTFVVDSLLVRDSILTELILSSSYYPGGVKVDIVGRSATISMRRSNFPLFKEELQQKWFKFWDQYCK